MLAQINLKAEKKLSQLISLEKQTIYRKKRGYTQAELAERIGMSVAYLGQIERGNRGNSFSLETLYQIADALKIDVNLLIKNEMLA